MIQQVNLSDLYHFVNQGTGGDILILEEAAYVDSGFFYEVCIP